MLCDCIPFMFELCSELLLELCTWALQTAECLTFTYCCTSGVQCIVCLHIVWWIDPYDESLDTSTKKPLVWFLLRLYGHMITSFMTFGPCQTFFGFFESESAVLSQCEVTVQW